MKKFVCLVLFIIMLVSVCSVSSAKTIDYTPLYGTWIRDGETLFDKKPFTDIFSIGDGICQRTLSGGTTGSYSYEVIKGDALRDNYFYTIYKTDTGFIILEMVLSEDGQTLTVRNIEFEKEEDWMVYTRLR